MRVEKKCKKRISARREERIEKRERVEKECEKRRENREIERVENGCE